MPKKDPETKSPLDILTDEEKQFVNNLCAGMTGYEAYMDAYPTENKKLATTKASLLKRRPRVAAAIQEINKIFEFRGVMDKYEIARYLSNAIQSPLSVVDSDNAVAQEVIEEQDEKGSKVKIKVVDKLKAADMLNKMMGNYEPEKVDVGAKGLADLLNSVRKGDEA